MLTITTSEKFHGTQELFQLLQGAQKMEILESLPICTLFVFLQQEKCWFLIITTKSEVFHHQVLFPPLLEVLVDILMAPLVSLMVQWVFVLIKKKIFLLLIIIIIKFEKSHHQELFQQWIFRRMLRWNTWPILPPF